MERFIEVAFRNLVEREPKNRWALFTVICGKISSPSLSHAEYFVTFIDDKTHNVWIYVVKHKHEVFQKLVE